MSPRLLLAACAFGLSAAPAEAYDWNFTVTLSSANDGASTLLSWERTGTVYFPTATVEGTYASAGYPVLGNPANAVSGTLPIGTLSYYATYSVSSTGLFIKNYTQDITQSIDLIDFMSGPGVDSNGGVQFQTASGPLSINSFPNTRGWLPLSVGDEWGFVGDAIGSVVLPQDFSIFMTGRWERPVNGGVTTLIINAGTPVPEPSTYGLMLGGLALAGAATRRRKTSR